MNTIKLENLETERLKAITVRCRDINKALPFRPDVRETKIIMRLIDTIYAVRRIVRARGEANYR